MKRSLIVLLLLSLIGLLAAEIKVLESQPGRLLVEYLVDDYQLADSGEWQRLDMPEANYLAISGAPDLPSLEFKVGIPAGAQVDYRILSTSTKELSLAKRIKPAPIVSRKDELSHYEYSIDEALYRQPATFIRNAGEHSYRSYSYVAFQMHPAVYDGNKSLKLISSALFEILINGDLQQESAPSTDMLSQQMLQSFLNPNEAQYWQPMHRNHIHYADFSRSPWWIRIETDKQGMHRINPAQLSSLPLNEIDPGSFRLFTTTGRPLQHNPAFGGYEFQEVPIFVAGEADGRFDAEDYIVFFGNNRKGWDHNRSIVFPNSQIYRDMVYFNPYSETYVYWLTFAGSFDTPPLRIQENNAVINSLSSQDYHWDSVHLETESQRRDRTGLVWYMSRFFGNSTQEYSFDIELPDLMADANNTLKFRMVQEDIRSEIFHYITVSVNDSIIPSNYTANTQQHRWYGTNMLEFSKKSNAFKAGLNKIKIKVWRGGSPDNLFLDYIHVDYKKALNKSNAQYAVNAERSIAQKYIFSGDASNTRIYKVKGNYEVEILPLKTEGGNFYFTDTPETGIKYYLAKANELYAPVLIKKAEPTNIAPLSQPVQSLIITPPLFQAQAQELAAFYTSQYGLATKVVLLEDIFTQFSGGHPDPGAIRQYIKHIYYNAPEPKIESLTLLGLGTFDWRNYSRLSAPKNHIPLYFSPESDVGLFSDDYFGMITTLRNPEIGIGRYPVSNVDELNLMIRNLKRYVQEPLPGIWRNSILSLADDFINGDSILEEYHTENLEELSNLLSPALLHEKIFGEEWEYDQFLNKPKVRDEIFRQINLGKLIWYYVGHGAFGSLGQENYFTGAVDMGLFQNPDMLTLFIAASCDVSAYDHWAYQSLGEKTVLLENRGAIASVSATTLSYAGGNQSLMKHFFRTMLHEYRPLGQALSLAKSRFYGDQNSETYAILGDPNLYVTPPLRDQSIELINIAASDTLYSRDIVQTRGTYSQSQLSGEGQQLVYDASSERTIRGLVVTRQGNRFFKGKVAVEDSAFEGGFILPDDINAGPQAMVLAYHWNDTQKQDYLAFYHPMPLSDSVQPDAAANDGPPQISIYLGTLDFRPGDTVSSSPTLYVKISDANGINLTGKSGHNILLVLDNSLQPISITDYFEYDSNSYTSGSLIYPLKNLTAGPHNLQVIAFDNYNLPAVATTHFIANKHTQLSIENFLVYPNPVRDDAHFSFIISESAEITLDIFSPGGKRIRRITQRVSPGFQTIAFDGKDSLGKRLANNTYFLRLRAKTDKGTSLEKREKMVIYK